MLAQLPGWVIDDVASVREEVADWIGLSSAELWRLAEMCARDAIWAVNASGERARILAHEDPLPESTRVALARLRAQASAHGEPR